jgi:hypothetical protein
MATARRTRLRWVSDEPLCALCAGPGSGDCAEHQLTHGVTVWLCHDHRSEAFLHRNGGRDFVASLAGFWTVGGGINRRQRAALDAHLQRRVAAEMQRGLPGSYSWPALRAEAEQRFADGEPPQLVIHELRTRNLAGEAVAPSIRTMRRWFNEARWLAATPPRRARPNDRQAPPQATWVSAQRRAINRRAWLYGWPVEWLPANFP